ncbi:MAG: phosphonate metabolism protein/1,5-bisphosphokinase (PRPP-forming) PhnN [Alphaproteobacteria bacterium]|nr:phosphonate metabolism protein/1,5-bisphosphokinase (PRPP-forming) PhnN [Alphaproteobacteria bacterium]
MPFDRKSADERRGLLFLVVGPSGVGKDSLIQGARRRLGDDVGYHFPTRLITRPEDAQGEDHQAVALEAFERLEAAGGFMLSWRAHGQCYGIPKSAEQALAEGRSVVVNVSRQIIDQARRRWPPVKVLLISAPHEVLRARLAARGREAGSDINKRLERAHAYRVSGDDVFEVVNADELEGAIDRFVALIESGTRASTHLYRSGVNEKVGAKPK